MLTHERLTVTPTACSVKTVELEKGAADKLPHHATPFKLYAYSHTAALHQLFHSREIWRANELWQWYCEDESQY